VANAAIVGLRERGKTVLFTDHLLSLLNMRELGAVYAHEIGHAKCRHVGAFIAWMCGMAFSGDVLFREVLEGEALWLQGGAGGALLLIWFAGFGWLSRRFELEADLFSVEVQGDLPALISALERVGVRGRDATSWRHFSTARRVAFLERALVDPAFRAGFKRRLGRFRTAGVVVALLGLALQGWSLSADLPGDRAVVQLARGEYAGAQSALRGLDGAEARELEPLVLAARSLPDATAAAVRGGLVAALEAGDLDRAWALAQLALLREEAGVRPLAEALSQVREGDTAGALEQAKGQVGAWGLLLRAALEAQE